MNFCCWVNWGWYAWTWWEFNKSGPDSPVSRVKHARKDVETSIFRFLNRFADSPFPKWWTGFKTWKWRLQHLHRKWCPLAPDNVFEKKKTEQEALFSKKKNGSTVFCMAGIKAPKISRNHANHGYFFFPLDFHLALYSEVCDSGSLRYLVCFLWWCHVCAHAVDCCGLVLLYSRCACPMI